MSAEIGPSTAVVIQQVVKTDRNVSSRSAVNELADSDDNVMEIVKSLSKIAADSLKTKDKS